MKPNNWEEEFDELMDKAHFMQEDVFKVLPVGIIRDVDNIKQFISQKLEEQRKELIGKFKDIIGGKDICFCDGTADKPCRSCKRNVIKQEFLEKLKSLKE